MGEKAKVWNEKRPQRGGEGGDSDLRRGGMLTEFSLDLSGDSPSNHCDNPLSCKSQTNKNP